MANPQCGLAYIHSIPDLTDWRTYLLAVPALLFYLGRSDKKAVWPFAIVPLAWLLAFFLYKDVGFK